MQLETLESNQLLPNTATDYSRRTRILWNVAQIAVEQARQWQQRANEAERREAEERTLREMVEAENAELRQALRALSYPALEQQP